MRPTPFLAAVLALLGSAVQASPAPAVIAEQSAYYFDFTPDSRAVVAVTADRRGLLVHEFESGVRSMVGAGIPEDEEINGPFFRVTADSRHLLVSTKPVGQNYDRDRQHLYVTRLGSGGELERIGEGFQDVVPLLVNPQPADGSHVVFVVTDPDGGGSSLRSYFFDSRQVVPLSRPEHPAAKVTRFIQSAATGAIAYVSDELEPDRSRLYIVAPDGEGHRELTKELPEGFRVPPTIIGRSDRDFDRHTVKFTPDGSRVIFGAQDPATGTGIYDTLHLFGVSADGGPIDSLIRPRGDDGVTEFWPHAGPGGLIASVRVGSTNTYAVDLEELKSIPLHPKAVGWQGTYKPIIAEQTGRVFMWGDLETQDVKGFLYSNGLVGGSLRKYEFTNRYAEGGALGPVLTPDERFLVFRAFPNGFFADTFELFVASPDGTDQRMLSRKPGDQEVKSFQVVGTGRGVLWVEGPHLWFRDLDQEDRVLLTPDLPDGDEVVWSKPSPDGTRAAFTVRKKAGGISLHAVELP